MNMGRRSGLYHRICGWREASINVLVSCSILPPNGIPLLIRATVFLEHCELIPEYAFHDQTLPVIYIRKIATTKGSKRMSNTSTTAVVGSNVTAVRETSTQWDDNSLYYRFGGLEDMFNFQRAFLGEIVEMDMYVFPSPFSVLHVCITDEATTENTVVPSLLSATSGGSLTENIRTIVPVHKSGEKTPTQHSSPPLSSTPTIYPLPHPPAPTQTPSELTVALIYHPWPEYTAPASSSTGKMEVG